MLRSKKLLRNYFNAISNLPVYCLGNCSSTPQLKWHIDEKDQIHVPSPKIFPQPTIPLEDLFHYDPKTAFSTINQVFKSINSNILDFSSLTQSILKAQPLDTPPHI